MASELSTSKTLVILAVVIGCFAVLWPKVFHPMLTSSTKHNGMQDIPHPHTRPERPSQMVPDGLHPALREKGRNMPQRTIEKQARPGPMPGIRPPMGGGAHMVPPQSKGPGTMGLIMPIYTVGIVIFFIYTIMKVLFKKNSDEDKVAKLKDFHMDPDYRKYIFSEEYLDSSNNSHRDALRRQERETSRLRKRQNLYPEPKLEDEQMDQLRRRLEETESAMERLMSQMGSVTDKLTAAKITQVLTQAQTQAKILKDEETTCDLEEPLKEDCSLQATLDFLNDSSYGLDSQYGSNPWNLHGHCNEQSTQTENGRKVSVLDLETVYQLKKQCDQTSSSSHQIKEYLLDAMVPRETQLLVQEAELELNDEKSTRHGINEKPSEPCVITSHVSLAFLGLEHNKIELKIPNQNDGSSRSEGQLPQMAVSANPSIMDMKDNGITSRNEKSQLNAVSSSRRPMCILTSSSFQQSKCDESKAFKTPVIQISREASDSLDSITLDGEKKPIESDTTVFS